MGPSPLEHLFNTQTIAVFGASESGHNVGSKLFTNLVEGGFKGKIFPINPKYKKVSGYKCYRSADEFGVDIDLAVIATPAKTVADILQ